MKTGQTKPNMSILIFLVSLPAVGALIFTPGLPALAEHFMISIGSAQLSVSFFLIGYAFGQLPWGPISNRYGRKPALYFGLCLQIVGSICSGVFGYLGHYPYFLLSVFITALGSSVGLKMTFTLIADSFGPKEATKRIAFVGLSFALAPGLAIAIGGALTHYINWQTSFFFLALYGAFLFLLSTILPETSKEIDYKALKIKNIIYGYLTQFRDVKLVISGIIWGFATALFYLFAEMAPIISQEEIGISAELYGYLNVIPMAGLFMGCLVVNRLVSFISSINLVAYGIGFIAVGTIIQWCYFYTEHVNIWSLFVPMYIIYFGVAIVFTNVSSIGLSGSTNKSNGSAVINFINIGLSVTAAFTAAIIPDKRALIQPSIFFFIIGLQVVMFLFLRRFTAAPKKMKG